MREVAGTRDERDGARPSSQPPEELHIQKEDSLGVSTGFPTDNLREVLNR